MCPMVYRCTGNLVRRLPMWKTLSSWWPPSRLRRPFLTRACASLSLLFVFFLCLCVLFFVCLFAPPLVSQMWCQLFRWYSPMTRWHYQLDVWRLSCARLLACPPAGLNPQCLVSVMTVLYARHGVVIMFSVRYSKTGCHPCVFNLHHVIMCKLPS